MDAGWLDRRGFLLSALGAAAAWATGATCHLPDTLFEGIYTDRFTYRQGQWILVACSLRSSQPVQVELLKYHSSGGHVAFHAAQAADRGNPRSAGIRGAMFPYVAAIDTTDLEPGYYGVSIQAELLQPETRENHYNSFRSLNYLARFVVTPRTPGSYAKILWVHDSLTGTCYGSFGGQSIYGAGEVHTNVVSYARPGLQRATNTFAPLRFLRDHGYEFEYADLVELTQMSAEDLAAYDLAVCIGEFEYMPVEAMERLADFVDAGGNLFVASDEFGSFRVRLDLASRQLVTFKTDFQALDPLYGTGSKRVAGVGMNIPEGILETELIGQCIWAAHHVVAETFVDLPLYRVPEVDWILEGLDLGSGDVLPGLFLSFATGHRLDLSSGSPAIVDPETTRTPPGTVVWAALPSPDGRDWTQANGRPLGQWPLLSDGYATATYQERPSGGRVVTLPTYTFMTKHLGEPVYDQLLLNIMQGLS